MSEIDFNANLQAVKLIALENHDTVQAYQKEPESFYLSFTPLALLALTLKRRFNQEHFYLVSGSQDFRAVLAALDIPSLQEAEMVLFLVRPFAHSVPVFFCKEKGQLRCFINDPCLSSSSLTPNLIYHILDHFGKTVDIILNCVKLQHSWNTCSTFALLGLEYCLQQGRALFLALDQANFGSFGDFPQVRGIHHVTDLPVEFVKIAESMQLLKHYVGETKQGNVIVDQKTGRSLFQYIADKERPEVSSSDQLRWYVSLGVSGLFFVAALSVFPPIYELLFPEFFGSMVWLWLVSVLLFGVAGLLVYYLIGAEDKRLTQSWFAGVRENRSATRELAQHLAQFQVLYRSIKSSAIGKQILEVYPLHLVIPKQVKLFSMRLEDTAHGKCQLVIEHVRKYDNLFYHSRLHCRFCGKTPDFQPLKIKGLVFSADKAAQLLNDPSDQADHELTITYTAKNRTAMLNALKRFRRGLAQQQPAPGVQLFALRRFADEAIWVLN